MVKKSSPATRHEGACGERKYSSYSFGARWGEWSASRTGRTPPPAERVTGTHWIGGWVWTQMLMEKSFRLCRGSKLDRSVVQSVVRHYTD
jgi:hypothetical protein